MMPIPLRQQPRSEDVGETRPKFTSSPRLLEGHHDLVNGGDRLTPTITQGSGVISTTTDRTQSHPVPVRSRLDRPAKGEFMLAALDYAARGWYVFPLGADSKLPREGSHGFLDATTDVDQIRKWWSETPYANVGISCGPSGLYVVDVDTKKGKRGAEGLKLITERIGADRMETLCAITASGGKHLYFATNATHVGKCATDAAGIDGIDVRAEGGYVVAPPSYVVYTVQEKLPPGRYDWLQSPQDMAPLPAELLAMLQKEPAKATPRKKSGTARKVSGPSPESKTVGASGFVQRALLRAESNPRNDTGFWLACQLRDNGCSREESETTMLDYVASLPEGTHAYTDREALASLEQAYNAPPRDPSFPTIETNARPLRDKSEDALNALALGIGSHAVYAQGDRLIRIETGEAGWPVAVSLDQDRLCHELERCARWVSTSQDRGRVPVSPPGKVVKDILAYPEWPMLPTLRMIVTAPVVTPNGTLITEPGMDRESGIYLHAPSGLSIPDTAPTASNVAAAKDLLLGQLLYDFPFADETSRTHALALLLTPFVRPLISGPTPLFLIDAPSAGTGKSLLTQACLCPFFAGSAPLYAEPVKEEEWAKVITSALMTAPSHIVFDNVKHTVKSGALAAAITKAYHKDRILGGSTETTVPVRCTWVMNGNNVTADGDIARRVVFCRLDAQAEDPAERAISWRLPNLQGWMTTEYPRVTGAALTLIRLWLEAGRHAWTGSPMGSFEDWSRIVGGILEASGMYGFLTNATSYRERSDTFREPFRLFVQRWYDDPRLRQEAGVKDLLPIATKDDLLTEWFGGDTERAQATKFGTLLRGQLERTVSVETVPTGAGRILVRMVKTRDLRHVAQYALEVVHGAH